MAIICRLTDAFSDSLSKNTSSFEFAYRISTTNAIETKADDIVQKVILGKLIFEN
jgi:hypothetical protein